MVGQISVRLHDSGRVDPKFSLTNDVATLDGKDTLGVRNTFLNISDAPSLKHWYEEIRGVRSCPGSERGADDDIDNRDDMENLAINEDSNQVPSSTPEPTPRRYQEVAREVSTKASVPRKETLRTPLKSGATPFSPPKTGAAYSTAYYAVPPVPIGGGGANNASALHAEYQGRVMASRAQHSQLLAPPVPQTPVAQVQNYPVAPHQNHKETFRAQAPGQAHGQVPLAVLGSDALPSIGSGSHATGECRPCAFFHSNRCLTGRTCLFCHLCDASEKKRRHRLQKISMKRAQGGGHPR